MYVCIYMHTFLNCSVRVLLARHDGYSLRPGPVPNLRLDCDRGNRHSQELTRPLTFMFRVKGSPLTRRSGRVNPQPLTLAHSVRRGGGGYKGLAISVLIYVSFSF